MRKAPGCRDYATFFGATATNGSNGRHKAKVEDRRTALARPSRHTAANTTHSEREKSIELKCRDTSRFKERTMAEPITLEVFSDYV